MGRAMLACAFGWLCACSGGGVSPASDGGPGTRHIAIELDGNGAITSMPAGLACMGDCAADLAGDVTLTAYPFDGWMFQGWSAPCAAAPACTIAGDTAASLVATFVRSTAVANGIFLTSTTTTGYMSGIAAADVMCTTTANAAGHTGSWLALMSTSTQDAIDRLGSSRGWVRFDGVPVFDTIADIAAGNWLHPIAVDENANPVINFVWTGTGVNGRLDPATPATCGDWVSNLSGVDSRSDGVSFEYGGSTSCTNDLSLICVQVGLQTPVPRQPMPIGRHLFTTQQAWLPHGVADADRVCALEATAAQLTGTYRALLATSTTSARDRFSDLEGPWRLVDDELIARDDLSYATDLLQAPFRDATGALNAAQVWTGANALTMLGTAATTCNDWTSSTSPATGSTGHSATTENDYVFGTVDTTNVDCGIGHHLYCVEER